MTTASSVPPPTVRHESNATVTMGYSAVSFVPTEHVQTAVSDYGDHIVIDTIIPPSRYLPPTLSVAKLAGQIQEDLVHELERLGLGMGSRIASVAHPRSKEAEAEQFIRGPGGQLLDPALLPQNSEHFARARLGVRSLRGEPLLTYFPTPKGAEPTKVNGSVTTCPCVCCRSGCTGADPATGRLPLLPEMMAKDQYGNVLVDVPGGSAFTESTPTATAVPPAATAAAGSKAATLGKPFDEAKRSQVQPTSSVTPVPVAVPTPADQAATPAAAAVSSRTPQAPQTMPSSRPANHLHTAKSMGDLLMASSSEVPPLPKDAAPSVPNKTSRLTVRASPLMASSKSTGNTSVSTRHTELPSTKQPTTRAEKGMSVFAPLQVSNEFEEALTLHDLSSLSLSPDMGRRTPPLSSPSSIGSTPRIPDARRADGSPPESLLPDPSVTPIAARYSRSASNLRQKAREQELPPLPPLPKDLSSPTLSSVQDTMPVSRVRIVPNPSPLMPSNSFGFAG
ncbi:hypothetical protein ACI68E_002971 [Malassezia pachydermatis]|uniref:Uncharacterized protein n=1 Tax=Malassezia pachydermatis TaxID=77020 RepID=A0A0M8MTC9_9BASI|nr:hypothetical protein Malapachy_3806 [Malassezia pachydermatis]KOS13954.1 hypothetical protein Malapachy_3806 [Malassezia pachydermatis]